VSTRAKRSAVAALERRFGPMSDEVRQAMLRLSRVQLSAVCDWLLERGDLAASGAALLRSWGKS